MKTIAFSIQKGGVGKSSLSVSMAVELAKIKAQKALIVYEFPVDPAFRKSQAAGITVQDLTGTKPETRAELHRLAADIIQEG